MSYVARMPVVGDLVAAFPMYDFPELRVANDALWTRLAVGLSVAGVHGVPAALIRDRSHFELWNHPRLLLAQACEYPLALNPAGAVRLVATPRYSAEGCEGALYRSAIIVRRDDTAETLGDMRGSRCAVNESTSNSGMNLLRATVAPFSRSGRFFGEVAFSGSHRRSVEMVVEGEADLAAIDCVTLGHLRRYAPDLTSAVRILCWTDPSPALPFITAAGTDDATVRALRTALADVIEDPAFDKVRACLFLEGFDFAPDENFTRVLTLAQRARSLGYPVLR